MIENLSDKAMNRNPDEFYHKMQKSRMVEGEHQVMTSKKRKADEKKDLALVGLKK
jgi:hypothetical protein